MVYQYSRKRGVFTAILLYVHIKKNHWGSIFKDENIIKKNQTITLLEQFAQLLEVGPCRCHYKPCTTPRFVDFKSRELDDEKWSTCYKPFSCIVGKIIKSFGY